MKSSPEIHTFLNSGSAARPHAPIAINGDELKALLSPVSCKEFVDSYFSKKSLSVPGIPGKFDHIFGWDKLNQALVRGQKILDKRYNITASFTGGEESGSRRRMITAYHDQVSELLQAGATICITNIHMADPALASWAQAIRAQLNFTGTVGVNCYVSPDGSGLPMHYDKRVATSIQIAGKKRWRYSTEPAKAWPDHNAVYQGGQIEPANVDAGRLPADMEFQEVELNAGDLLCLPAGAWHSACGVGESLALNLYFAPRNYLDQLMLLLREFAASNESWRGGPPATAEKLAGTVPDAVSVYIRERLAEFHRMATEVINGPDALAEHWLDALTNSPYTGWQPKPKVSVRGATPEQRFQVPNPPLRFVEKQDKIAIPCDHGVLRIPASVAPVLHHLNERRDSFTIPDLLAWQKKNRGPSPNDIVACLQVLTENELVTML